MRLGGFTLIEIIVVVSIISLLAAVVGTNYSNVRTESRIKAEQATLEQMKLAFTLYAELYGHYPAGVTLGGYPMPNNDNCSSCFLRPPANLLEATIQWGAAASAMIGAGLINDSIFTDSWGMPYAYDNNSYGAHNVDLFSFVCSTGPDRVWGVSDSAATIAVFDRTTGTHEPLGDDICVFLPN
jgi:prepilin-type N-terminal cleavage/methylation domain-containing protein